MMIVNADCLDWMREQQDNSIDFIVTDPPYGLKFMGKKWDNGIPGVGFWSEMLRVCKPGSMLAAFGGTRTFHRLTCAIEDAGWEIRDCICWLYGSGFPKSHNKFGLEGYGTALKPAWEPIILAMKPLDGTYAQNAEKWDVAGINIDATRIPMEDKWTHRCHDITSGGLMDKKGRSDRVSESNSLGRWPANLILDREAAALLDEQTGILKSGAHKPSYFSKMQKCLTHNKYNPIGGYDIHANSGGASRFFYCAKASSSERNAGLEKHCIHPTVKPLALMRYIIKLLAPPGDPILLDPFAGSESTLVAAKQLRIRAIGIEKEDEYAEIAKRRIKNTQLLPEQFNFEY